MKALAVVFSLALTSSVFAQTTRTFGSVVFPGGTATTTPGVTRNFGSVVFPGGSSVPVVRGGPPVVGGRPGTGFTNPNSGQVHGGQPPKHNPAGHGSRTNIPYVYAYPVYVGGGYDNSYASQEPAPPPPPANVTVVYPPAQRATPVMIEAGPQGGEYYTRGQGEGATVYDGRRAVEEEPVPDSNRYLIAFKDHTIYSAVAYWADGDTLHYFTTGSTHNQVSMSLLDRELTERLNRELGTDFKLPK